ncbi:radical SAM-modified peptide, FtsH ternary system-associated [Saccharothrix sp.]|uniref:radical SAM-modified peptide, FtsH ternary system-associated n=1 Tax=Saccharothrix sp. TaxID=1873460 RepID=UPI002810F07C|nr:radical SAM-modified peptide, FtsH ternary system-associated [Saccharothrix sp.]
MTNYEFVDSLPDLVQPEEYADHPTGGLVRLRISVENGEISILGDALRPELIEQLLEALGPDAIQQMLCG